MPHSFSLSDETLAELKTHIERAAGGDRQAWNRVFELSYEIVRERVRSILGYSFPRLIGAHDATSVTNQLYLKLHQTLVGGDDTSMGTHSSGPTFTETPPSAPVEKTPSQRVTTLPDYLRLIAWFTRNLLITLAEKHDRRPKAVNDSNPVMAGEPDRAAAGPEWEASWRELHSDGLNRLSADEREVFEQRYYNGLSAAQIGAISGVSEKTIRRRWVAAMEKLGDFAMPLQ